jgi:acetyl-CoA carboxylase biotin carboxyl carrier protein
LLSRVWCGDFGSGKLGASMNLDFDKLRDLLDVLAEREVAEFEHESGGVRIKIVRGAVVQASAAHLLTQPGAGGATASAALAPVDIEAASDQVDVTSPFVGTFYRSPTPDTPSFVELGSVVRAGQTLCIIEAMKLMNEIEAESSGTIVEIFAQNGKAVEFGQKLFRIKKA